jgi:hypothetical protein
MFSFFSLASSATKNGVGIPDYSSRKSATCGIPMAELIVGACAKAREKRDVPT